MGLRREPRRPAAHGAARSPVTRSDERSRRSSKPAKGAWTRGDVVRVRLEIEAQSDMGWVVVEDPVPAGASILGGGLGRDSTILTGGERREGWVRARLRGTPLRCIPRLLQLRAEGIVSSSNTRCGSTTPAAFVLPTTRVEAMYAPEMFGELPNEALEVRVAR